MQMKRLTAALLALAAIVMLALPASADVGWKTTQLGWRFHQIAGTSAAYSFARADYTGPYADSLEFHRVGSGGATMSVANAETSTVFSNIGNPPAPHSWGINDTTTIFRVIISDAGETATSVDSLLLAAQVSADGRNWVYVNPLLGVAGVNPITATSVRESGFQLLNTAGATTSVPKVFQWSVGKLTTGTGAMYPDRNNFITWPYIRFILMNKTVGAVIHNFTIRVQHFANVNPTD
jgi:hypothetical protein